MYCAMGSYILHMRKFTEAQRGGWFTQGHTVSVVLEKTPEGPLDSKEIKAVNPKRNQPWIFMRRTDAEAEASVFWPPDLKCWFTGEDPGAGKDMGEEVKWGTEDEVVGWHHWLNGHEFKQTPGDSEGQGSLVCCRPWGYKESDTTEWLNNNSNNTVSVLKCVFRPGQPTRMPSGWGGDLMLRWWMGGFGGSLTQSHLFSVIEEASIGSSFKQWIRGRIRSSDLLARVPASLPVALEKFLSPWRLNFHTHYFLSFYFTLAYSWLTMLW